MIKRLEIRLGIRRGGRGRRGGEGGRGGGGGGKLRVRCPGSRNREGEEG